MAVSDSIRETMHEKGWTHQQLADVLHHERSYVTKMISGERQIPEALEPKLSKWSWKLANRIADERTGGYIPDILKLVPDYDLHPSAAKEILKKDLHEAIAALDKLSTAKHICASSRKANAANAWHETRDVIQKAMVMLGVLEDEYGLDRERLMLEHDMQVKNGER